MKFILVEGIFLGGFVAEPVHFLGKRKRNFSTPFSKEAKYCKLILEQKLCHTIEYDEVAQMQIMIFWGFRQPLMFAIPIYAGSDSYPGAVFGIGAKEH